MPCEYYDQWSRLVSAQLSLILPKHAYFELRHFWNRYHADKVACPDLANVTTGEGCAPLYRSSVLPQCISGDLHVFKHETTGFFSAKST
jgi:hypothetical protein